jgi:hypothetical protein
MTAFFRVHLAADKAAEKFVWGSKVGEPAHFAVHF